MSMIQKQIEIVTKVLHYFNLEAEHDNFDKIHDTIEKDVVFKGTNLWILMFAIIIASVGLNVNSTAVIIGAMLISPLMGPINGIGYSLATYDFLLLRKAIKNFAFAVGASLIASSLYFALTPISTAHSELLARTSPTIYDVLIALFGGLAGIVAISSKQKGNVIPGVAIATALMPPLCTAGYGLGTGQLNYFFGAFYLFTINTVFIALSTVMISKLLNFPIRTIVEEHQKTKVTRWISVVMTLTLVPSIYFGYRLVQQEKFSLNASKFVDNVSVVEGNFLLKNDINAAKRIITLVYGGESLSDSQKEDIVAKAADFSIEDAKILFKQGLSFDAMKGRNVEIETLKAEIGQLNSRLLLKQAELDSLNSARLIGQLISNEIQGLFPNVMRCTIADGFRYASERESVDRMVVVVIKVKSGSLNADEKARLQKWLQLRLKTTSLKVFVEKQS